MDQHGSTAAEVELRDESLGWLATWRMIECLVWVSLGGTFRGMCGMVTVSLLFDDKDYYWFVKIFKLVPDLFFKTK